MRPQIASPSSQTLIHQRRSNQPGVTGLWEETSTPEELMEPGSPKMYENPADEEDLSPLKKESWRHNQTLSTFLRKVKIYPTLQLFPRWCQVPALVL